MSKSVIPALMRMHRRDLNHKWFLQFFADGASGGDGGGEGAETGVETGAADRTLESLGVPKDKAERFRQKHGNKMQPPVEQAPQAAEVTEQAPPAAPDWDTFFENPENKQRLQQMMAERGKKATEAQDAAKAAMAKLTPALGLIASRYGIQAGEDGQYDLDAITQAVTNDDSYYEKKAEELGVDASVARQIEEANMARQQAEARERALLEQQARADREFQLQQHFLSMQQQANKLREIYPDFDLDKELQDPVFFNRTAPGPNSMSVEDAFYSMHHDAIMQKQAEAIARRAKADVAKSISSGVRPRENGGSATAAVSSTPDIQHMNREDRRAYIMAKYKRPPR